MLSWIWLCDRDRSVTLCHKAGVCFTWCVQELLRCSARTVLGWSRQILRLSRLGRYGQIKIQYGQHLCRLSAIFHIFRCLGSFFLAEPPEWPFSLWKSQLVPLVSLILCFQPTDHNCRRSETPPWGQGAVKWLLSPCLVTDEACGWSPRGSHSIVGARSCWGQFLATLDTTDTNTKNQMQRMI